MDRLSLLKALADDSRYVIFVEVSRSGVPLSTTELARRLDLHPNTVRLHLERLREVGLVEVSTLGQGAVGRPQHRWTRSLTAPSLGLEPSGFRVLAHLLAEVAATTGPPEAATVDDVGRRAGAALGSTMRPDPPDAGSAAGGPVPACLDAVVDELAALGFDPVLEVGPEAAAVAFTSCPFRELATAYPDLVCALHRGITEGIVAGVAAQVPGVAAELAGFSTLVDADPCRAELAVAATG